ncbi:MAG: pPIWI_RE module domain-containing protein [Nostoc sp.]
MTKIILPGAWELTATNPTYKLSVIYVSTTWRQVANNLAQQRARLQGKSYRAVPVYSLEPLVVGSFPKIIKTLRNGWQKDNVPWLLATETTDISDLGNLIKDWLIEEFSSLEDVESQLANLNNDDWRWEDSQTYELLYPQNKVETSNLYQAIPDYLAKEFLKNPRVSFGVDEQYQLTFYRVVSLQSAELMSWPPSEVTVTKGKETTETAYISFVIEFVLQTVPWREKPIVYHQLSIRRWLTKPLNYVPYPGVKAHIGDNRRWLDGQRQLFCFIPLTMNRYGKEVKWPQAINNLLSLNDSQLPDANNFVSNPNHNWSGVNTIPSGIQAAIAYTSKLGEPPCFAGVSPQDLASLDQAIEAHLPVQRVGEAERVTGNVFIFWPFGETQQKIIPLLARRHIQFLPSLKAKKSDDPNHSHTPMLRPKLVAPAVFREAENPLRTILVLWETPQCRNALIAEICQLLYLSPTKVENRTQRFLRFSVYQDSTCLGDLTQDLEVQHFSEQRKLINSNVLIY